MEAIQIAKKKGEEPETKEEEKKEPVLPIAEFGLNFGGLFKGLGDFINSTIELAKKGQELQRTGELRDKAGKLRGMYGVSVGIGREGKPIVQEFGTRIPTLKPEEGVREPLVDVFEEDDEIAVTAELPGIKEGDIKVEVEGKKLKIDAETGDRKYAKEVDLPSTITGEPQSTYKNGVLDVKLRKKA